MYHRDTPRGDSCKGVAAVWVPALRSRETLAGPPCCTCGVAVGVGGVYAAQAIDAVNAQNPGVNDFFVYGTSFLYWVRTGRVVVSCLGAPHTV